MLSGGKHIWCGRTFIAWRKKEELIALKFFVGRIDLVVPFSFIRKKLLKN